MSDHAPKATEAREQVAEKSLRPDIQGGALRMAEGESRTSTSIHPCATRLTATTRRDGCAGDVTVEASW